MFHFKKSPVHPGAPSFLFTDVFTVGDGTVCLKASHQLKATSVSVDDLCVGTISHAGPVTLGDVCVKGRLSIEGDHEIKNLLHVGDVKMSFLTEDCEGWAVCNGRPLSASRYASLFDIIGYTHGGDGDVFNLPHISPMQGMSFFIYTGITE